MQKKQWFRKVGFLTRSFCAIKTWVGKGEIGPFQIPCYFYPENGHFILRAIFAAMEQGVVFIDDRNRIGYCNPAAERIRNIHLNQYWDSLSSNVTPRKAIRKLLK